MKAEHTPICATEPLSPAGGCEGAAGLLVVDKPENLTSFTVVARVRKQLRLKKIGHCGTLDPFATGVLLLCLNQATRIVDQLSVQDKVYEFTACFGVETDTLDRTGIITRTGEPPACSAEEFEGMLNAFRGIILQQVPGYSAVKIKGQRLYALTRKGIEVDRPMREVHIQELEVLAFHWPIVQMRARCSKGTYIRQLAADMGESLGCGAHVTELRRLASGAFHIGQAVPLEELQGLGDRGWQQRVISMNEALSHLPRVDLHAAPLRRLGKGTLDPGWEREQRQRFSGHRGPVRLSNGEGQLVALWWPEPGPGERKLRVLQEAAE